jgi:hypothetical protein
MTKQREKKTQINKVRDKKGEIKTNTIKSRESLESTLKTYLSKLENLDEILEVCIQPKLNQEDIDHVNSPTT